MLLAKEEELIREWEYAEQKSGLAAAKMKLIVTNKRIISDVTGLNKVERDEIKIADVKSVSMVRRLPSKALSILLFVLGGIFALMAFALMGEIGSAAAVFLLPAIALIIVGMLNLRKGSISVIIRTKGLEGSSMFMGASTLIVKKLVFKAVVHNEVAEQIVEELGKLIIENS